MTLITGERYRPSLEAGLKPLVQEILWLPDNPSLDGRLAGHTDLSVFRPDTTHIIVGERLHPHFVKLLTNRGVSVISSGKQGPVYPADAGLCVCYTGKYTLFNCKTVDAVAEKYLSGTLIQVPQGYTKCSVCAVSSDAIITSDDVTAQRASDAGMDVLKIRPGYIALPGYGHGFIGGAAFKTDEQTMAFTGTLDHHPDKPFILAFLAKHGVQAVFLTAEPIFDIGGAVILP